MDEYVDEIIYNKIYARPNENNIVVHFFSEVFEKPLSNDICIDEYNEDRHGANNYQVYDENGIYNYCIVNGKLTERDKSSDILVLEKLKKIQELKLKLIQTDYKAIKYAEGSLSSIEYSPIKNQREEWRREIRRLEGK